MIRNVTLPFGYTELDIFGVAVVEVARTGLVSVVTLAVVKVGDAEGGGVDS